jgi:bacteriocin biosynthesis cyclodehydratase domain-containing protein
MSTVIRFKRFVIPTTVPGDAVYLTSERPGQVRLQGPLVERMAPLLTGDHDRAGVVAALSGDFGAERVERAIDKLMAAGHVEAVDSTVDVRAGGYWEMMGVDGDAAVGALSAATVDLVTVGDVRAEWFTAAAGSVGLRVGAGGSVLTVVLTDDYLRPELADINRAALDQGRPWLLIKPVGSLIWVGPVFEPGRTGCYHCLRVRLASKHLLLSYLNQREVISGPLITSVADVPATVELASRLGALQAAKFVTGVFAHAAAAERDDRFPSIEPAEVVTLDTVTLEQTHHPLNRRPQCSVCGDRSLQAERQQQPVEPVSRPKTGSGDGGHRATDAQQFLDRYKHLVSPITGPVSSLTRVPIEVDGLYTYNAGQNFAIPMANVSDLRAGLRSMSSGKGMTDLQARASALGEAIERYSGLFHNDEARIVASYNELGPDAIHPNASNLYSDEQFAARDEWNRRPSHFHRVCAPLDPDARIEWTPMWSLTQQRHRYFPTAGLFFSYAGDPKTVFSGANSNGCAAGTSLEDAMLQGFMELVERDTVAMWWYHRLRRPAIDLATFDEPYFQRWQDRYRSLNRDTWVLDVTNDLGIPSVVAVSYRTDKPAQDILFSFGAHFDVKIAIGRALSEMNQFLPAVIGMKADGSGRYAFDDPDQLDWWQHATLADHPYLLPADTGTRTAKDFHDPSGADLLDDLRLAQKLVENKGLELLVLDQTRVDIGLPVVKMMVPGMRHFWPRYAPGRLYDVPLELGWLSRPATESDLNPIAMFL